MVFWEGNQKFWLELWSLFVQNYACIITIHVAKKKSLHKITSAVSDKRNLLNTLPSSPFTSCHHSQFRNLLTVLSFCFEINQRINTSKMWSNALTKKYLRNLTCILKSTTESWTKNVMSTFQDCNKYISRFTLVHFFHNVTHIRNKGTNTPALLSTRAGLWVLPQMDHDKLSEEAADKAQMNRQVSLHWHAVWSRDRQISLLKHHTA